MYTPVFQTKLMPTYFSWESVYLLVIASNHSHRNSQPYPSNLYSSWDRI